MLQRGKTMSNSWSLWRLDRGCFTLLDQLTGGWRRTMPSGSRQRGSSGKNGGGVWRQAWWAGLDKAFYIRTCNQNPPQSITATSSQCTWASTMVRVELVPEVEVHHRRVRSGEPPREAQFGVRALLKDTRTRHSWQSPGPWGCESAHLVTVACFSQIFILHPLLWLPSMTGHYALQLSMIRLKTSFKDQELALLVNDSLVKLVPVQGVEHRKLQVHQ